MKKKANIVLFSSCFIIAVILEAYCIQVFNGDLFSVIGIGVVVLITGYLLMDSISTKIFSENQKIMYYMDHNFSEQADKWNERYSSLVDIQKATYTATKKNTAMTMEQFESILLRLETLENNNAKTLQKMMELQKKSLEGQKKALNIEVNYGRDNTTQIVELLKTQGERLDKQEQLSIILDWMEKNNELLKENLTNQQNNTVNGKESNHKESTVQKTEVRNDLLEEDSNEVDFDFSSMGSFDITDTSNVIDMERETEEAEIVEPEEDTYLFDTVEDTAIEGVADSYIEAEVIEDTNDTINAEAVEVTEDTINAEVVEDTINAEVVEDTIDAEVVEKTEDTIHEEGIEETDIKNAPEISEIDKNQSEPEAVDEIVKEKSADIAPLYADPNKALTADEIAALFASFGN